MGLLQVQIVVTQLNFDLFVPQLNLTLPHLSPSDCNKTMSMKDSNEVYILHVLKSSIS
jgi:hypothetical protein